MSARTSLQARVELYLVERSRLGFCGRDDACTLRSFARHVQASGHRGPLTVEVMAEWARCDSRGSSEPHTWARRLKKLRSFMRWLQQFESRTEVPDNAIFGRLPERQTPHIYSEQEIVDLLAAEWQNIGLNHFPGGQVIHHLDTLRIIKSPTFISKNSNDLIRRANQSQQFTGRVTVHHVLGVLNSLLQSLFDAFERLAHAFPPPAQ